MSVNTQSSWTLVNAMGATAQSSDPDAGAAQAALDLG